MLRFSGQSTHNPKTCSPCLGSSSHTQHAAAPALNVPKSAVITRRFQRLATAPVKLCATSDASDASDASRRYLNMFKALSDKEKLGASPTGLESVVRKFCPVLVFHNQEKYVCCTEEYYVDGHSLIQEMDDAPAKTIIEQLQKQLKEQMEREKQSKDADADLTEAMSTGNGLCMEIVNRKDRMSSDDRNLSNIPLFAKLKKGKLPNGEKILDINYTALMAYSGPNRVFFGSHIGGCEHITVRCTTDGRLISVYYGAHGEHDGTWVPAKDCPVDGNTGRLLGFMGLHGHGIYPSAGSQPRSKAFFLLDDSTSSKGRVWGCKECLIVGYPDAPLRGFKVSMDQLGHIETDRGCEHTEGYDGEPNQFNPRLLQTRDNPANATDIRVSVHSVLGQKKRVNAVLRCARKSAAVCDKEGSSGEGV